MSTYIFIVINFSFRHKSSCTHESVQQAIQYKLYSLAIASGMFYRYSQDQPRPRPEVNIACLSQLKTVFVGVHEGSEPGAESNIAFQSSSHHVMQHRIITE